MNLRYKRNNKMSWQMMCFGKKVKTRQHQNKTSNIKNLPETEIEPRSRTAVGCVTSGPPSQLKIRFVVKLFNCFNAFGSNVNKQSQMCGPHIFNKHYVYFHIHG